MSDNISPLTDLLSFVVDNRGKTVPTSDEGTPLIATNCIKHSSIYPTFENIRYVDDETMNSWFRAHPQPNDIIFVNKGTPGRVCLVPDPVPFCFAQDMIGFRCDPDKIDYQYLFAVLRSDYIQRVIENYHVGLVIPHFKKGDLDNLKIPRLATRDQELAVGNFYLSISKKIETNNQIISTLEDMVKTLYDYWFVQYEYPDNNGNPYKHAGGQFNYSNKLKRDIPSQWVVKPLKDHLICNSKKLGKKHDKEEINYLDTANLTKNVVGNIQKFVIDTDKVPSRANMIVSKDDILYSTVRPNQLHYGLLKNPVDNMVASTGFCVLTSKVNSEFNCVYYLNITSEHNTKKLIRISESSKSSYPSISPDDILNLYIALPDDNELLEKASKILNPVFEKISDIQDENKELQSLRDWLLPMLMNGQVTVK